MNIATVILNHFMLVGAANAKEKLKMWDELCTK